MDSFKENISFLKQFVKRRETYIRFSPFGTLLAGLLFVIYYFVGNFFDGVFSQKTLFLGCGAVAIMLVTILSLRNSLSRGEKAFPPSIKSVVVNLCIVTISFFAILSLVGHSYLLGQGHIETIILATIFYGLLILVSRHNLPNYISYFGGIVFAMGVLLSAGLFNTYVEEVGFFLFGIGHIVVAAFLKYDNDSNEYNK